MRKYEEKILNELIDQYERSKSFVGENMRTQSFRKQLVKLFPGYDDNAKYDLFISVNEQISNLENLGLITVKRHKRGKIETDVVSSVALVMDEIDECYKVIGRKPKTDINEEIESLLNKYHSKTELLTKFCTRQQDRLSQNKKVQYADDLVQFDQILKTLAEIENVEDETYIRNFSIQTLGDSKAFEKIKSQVVSILFEYGDYPSKENLLEELNIVKNPGYVYLKGNGSIDVFGQEIDLGKLRGPIGLSSAMLEGVENIRIRASKVITIENLTTFHSYMDDDAFVIYLGGYHNNLRRKMICRIYENNPNLKFYHYGDIDAGGFYILLDLRKKTGIYFEPLNMDVDTMEKYKDFTKPLTENDRTRLRNLRDGEFEEVVEYMLEQGCKLEQEAVGVFDR